MCIPGALIPPVDKGTPAFCSLGIRSTEETESRPGREQGQQQWVHMEWNYNRLSMENVSMRTF